jgi:S-adenosylmethionine:tRNA ribosyltransferase-isomerase
MFAVTGNCRWKCIVGNVKRWKDDILSLYNPSEDAAVKEMGLKAALIERQGETSIVEFRWDNGAPFSQVLEVCGNIPIPPYLNRETEDIDLERYQTLYAKYRGSVAAPTAGLHFTEQVLDAIKAKNIEIQTVCLHVGAGTFLPVKSSLVSEHNMHREPFVVTVDFLRKLRSRLGSVIAVGTTSVRTLESLYYIGVSCIEKGEPSDVDQWAPYSASYSYSCEDALDALIRYMDSHSMSSIQIGTRIIIVPGFQFRLVDILITNFHQPQSTLLLLVSAFTGGNWQEIYTHALENDYRFLSYGDSSIIY